MEKFIDCYGTEINVGDHIIFVSSYARGSTALKKAEIVAFTPKGRVMIMKKVWDAAHYRATRESVYNEIPKAVMAFYAKACDGKGALIY